MDEVDKIAVDVYKAAHLGNGTGAHRWHPESHEAADHSIPYVVAAALIDGTVTTRSFDHAHLRNPRLRALMNKITVAEDRDFTAAYERLPMQHCARVSITVANGERLTQESRNPKN